MPFVITGPSLDDATVYVPPPPAVTVTTPPPAAPSAPPSPPPAISAPAPQPPPDALVPPGIVRPPETSPSVILVPAVPAVPPDQTQPDAGATPPPPATDTGSDDGGGETQLLPDEDGPDLDAYQFFSVETYGGQQFATRLRTLAARYNIDPLAAAANALREGIGGGIGDSGTAYGPWQIHLEDGRIRSFRGRPKNDPAVNVWAWTQDGMDYAFRSMVAGGAAGKTGRDAVHAIVYGFEKPASEAAEYLQRADLYDRLDALGGEAWTVIATAAKGPQASSSSPSIPTAVGHTSVGAQTQYSTLLDVFSIDVPKRKRDTEIVASDIRNVFT